MEILILILLIFVNALIVVSEIALISARRSRIESLANKGDEKAKKALHLIDHPERFLSTAQIGMTLIAILTGVYSGEKFGDDLKPFIEQFEPLKAYAGTIATTIVVIIVTFLSVIFGELIPKKLAMLKAEKIARSTAGTMHFVSSFLKPLVWLLSGISNLIFKIFNIKKPNDS
jgi:putative hemolysin